MTLTYLADEYGSVLFQLGIEKKACSDFAEKLDACPELYTVLDSPAVTITEKHRVIDRVFEKEIRPFLKCLCDNGRIELYKEIYNAYIKYENDKNSVIGADFICANIPDKAELDKIKAMLIKKYNKKDADLRVIQDKDLLGGFMLKVGDTLYDKSLKGAINGLKRKLERR